MTLKKALESIAEFKQAYEQEETTRELIDTAFVLEDLTRNASVHAAGVVIGDRAVRQSAPAQKGRRRRNCHAVRNGSGRRSRPAEDGFPRTQDADGHPQHLRFGQADHAASTFHIENIPLDDAAAYDLLNKANTIGIFQLESGGMRDLCREVADQFHRAIIALVALYRPGRWN